MKRPRLVAAGVVVALLGLLFTLQGVGVLTGSSMSNTTTWSVAGPVIIVIGLALAGFGARGRIR
jgi:xanthine/uracil permease